MFNQVHHIDASNRHDIMWPFLIHMIEYDTCYSRYTIWQLSLHTPIFDVLIAWLPWSKAAFVYAATPSPLFPTCISHISALKFMCYYSFINYFFSLIVLNNYRNFWIKPEKNFWRKKFFTLNKLWLLSFSCPFIILAAKLLKLKSV